MNIRNLSLQQPPRPQAGMTTLGFIILASFIGLFAFAAIRLTPIYLEHMKIIGVIDGVQKEYNGQNPTRSGIVTSISRRFDIEGINVIKYRDVKVKADGGSFTVTADYENATPFISNVWFTVKFNKSVVINK